MFAPAIGLSTHLWNNNARALLLPGCMAFGVSVVFSSGADSLAAAFAHAWRNLPWYFGLGLILAGAWFAIALAAHQRIMDWLTGARPVTRETDKRLWDLMETICISRGETMPRLGLAITTDAHQQSSDDFKRVAGDKTPRRAMPAMHGNPGRWNCWQPRHRRPPHGQVMEEVGGDAS